MKSIFSWVSTPYYFNPSIKFKFKTSLILGLFVFSFLYTFKPFYLITLKDLLLEYVAGIGVIAFLGSFFMLYVPALIFKNYFNEDNWTVGKNILFVIISLFFVGSFLWFFANVYKAQNGIKNISLVLFLTYTFLVGVIPVLFVVFINEKNVREKREKRAEDINRIKNERTLKKEKTLKTAIIIYSDNKKEFISFNIKNLVYITSQGNYASFFIKNEKELKEKILRVTLAKIENKLLDYTNIIRCHKSYIINSNFISDVSGNARGYLLKSDAIPFKIPVSRSFSKQSLESLLS